MSLSSSIQLANNSLKAAQIGLQVVGQNIANANTPGYIREEVVYAPAGTQKKGDLVLGLGVKVEAIVQKVDSFLENRLRGAVSDRASAEAQEDALQQLEGLIGELTDTDLSTSLNNFFNSVSEVLNQPESVTVRNLAVLQGDTLARDIQQIHRRAVEIRNHLNGEIENISGDINRLTKEIAELNFRIAETEGGGSSSSDAVGLRDQRLEALSELSEIIEIRALEQPDGTVSVYAEGDFLVLGRDRREVGITSVDGDGLVTSEIRIVATDSPLQAASGRLAGLYAARDSGGVGAFIDRLNTLAESLVFEFNRVFSGGQGLTGYETLTSEVIVTEPDSALDAAGLPFTPENGSFDVLVRNEQTGLTSTQTILVDLNGLDEDLTASQLVAQINAIDGLTAQFDVTGKVQIDSADADTTFAFANDTSGVLAALGINTFFTGSSASDIGVSSVLREDPSKFAASREGIGEDTENAVDLAAFPDRILNTQTNETISSLYDRLVNETVQASTVAQSVADGFRVFESQLEGEKLGISGVNLDEEAVRMITLQRTYQASARYIATIAELLEVLVNL
ncbi:MAG: flagellar hook-associated protein FlgK [Planctomycetales bacterium]|nr:flagellar hook-associated protein FlgK [Planctomycetales bacterium]